MYSNENIKQQNILSENTLHISVKPSTSKILLKQIIKKLFLSYNNHFRINGLQNFAFKILK